MTDLERIARALRDALEVGYGGLLPFDELSERSKATLFRQAEAALAVMSEGRGAAASA